MDRRTDEAPEAITSPIAGPIAGPALRAHAEAIVLKTEALSRENNPQALSLEATQQALHELRVHQIELEMQNEELRRVQVDLAAAEARYFDLFDLAPVGYCVVSDLGLIKQANLTATSLLGIHRGTLVKQPISRFIYKADQDIYYLARKQLLATHEPQTCDLRMLKQDGTHFWARLACTFAQDANGAPLLRVALTDVTERVRLREALEEKNVELERATAVAENATRAKSDFLSNMSHELRSPLNAILGFAQLMESDATPQTVAQKENTGRILQAGWYLLDLINEILDLTLVESGKLLLLQEPVSLNEVLLDCQAMIEPQAQKNSIRMSFPRFDRLFFVNADRTRVKQVFINLLSNAIKYNQVGGTVVIDCTAVSEDRTRISVKDTGAGLPPEKIAQLFQPFNRLGKETSGEEGTGIGLAMTKRLVELMGGVIGVESTVGVGSVFWVELARVDNPVLTIHKVNKGSENETGASR